MKDLEKSINFSRKLLKTKNVYRSPILYIGRGAYKEYLENLDTHVWTQHLCVYVSSPDEIHEYVDLNGMGIHIESNLSPFELEPVARHFTECGAKAVFCTNLETKQTVLFSEELKDAA